MKIDPDAVMWSAPERERAGRPLLVLMHGYGSHEGDLFSLAPGLPLSPVIASLRAPIQSEPGNMWFPLSFDSRHPFDIRSEDLEPNADAAADAVLDWLDTTESTSVGLLGFSQGGATALQLLRLAPERFTYAVVLGGWVVGGTHPGDDALQAVKPPVFWGRGTLDEAIPRPTIEWTTKWLGTHTSLKSRIYEGLGHSISNPELRDVSAFISSHL